ncbi:MAG: hypothetical protein ACR2PG_20145 [Hyphomicrobiaceae bacterium]
MQKQTAILLGCAAAVWMFCGALIGIGRQYLSMDTTLIVHAVGAPIGAVVLSWLYFRNFAFTGPLVTATIFVATALILDVFVVALLIEKSFDMFQSVLGLWLPQILIFAATYVTGWLTMSPRPNPCASADETAG